MNGSGSSQNPLAFLVQAAVGSIFRRVLTLAGAWLAAAGWYDSTPEKDDAVIKMISGIVLFFGSWIWSMIVRWRDRQKPPIVVTTLLAFTLVPLVFVGGVGCIGVTTAEYVALREGLDSATLTMREEHKKWTKAIAEGRASELPAEGFAAWSDEQKKVWKETRLFFHDAYKQLIDESRKRYPIKSVATFRWPWTTTRGGN